MEKGILIQKNTTNSLIRANDRLVTVIGADDLIVVDTVDAVMIANRKNSQDVKTLVDELKEASRREYENHLKVLRPWGSYETLEMGENFQVKRIVVNPGKRLSLCDWVSTRSLFDSASSKSRFERGRLATTSSKRSDSPTRRRQVQFRGQSPSQLTRFTIRQRLTASALIQFPTSIGDLRSIPDWYWRGETVSRC